MRYQEGLLATLRTLWELRQRLNTAKAELASLMNIRPGTDFQLKPEKIDRELPEINTVVTELEEYGLLHRPELIEEDYRLQIDSAEIRKAMLRMLPGIEVNAGAHYDSNDFLVNNEWADAGLRISWNLFNLFRGPKDKERAEAQVELDETRRLATGMAVLTQINVAQQRYENALQDYRLSENLLQVKNEIAAQEAGRFESDVSNKLSLIRTRLDRLVAQMQRDLALAELQNAAGRVHNSIGLDPLPTEIEDDSLESLSLAVATHQQSLKGMLSEPQLDPNMYDEIAREIALARAKERRQEALRDKEAAKEALAEAARRKAEREARAAEAADAALAAQQEAIAAAVKQADAERLAEEEAARQRQLVAEKQQAAEAARRAAEAAAAAAQAAEQQARQAAEARQARLQEISQEVEVQVNQAVEAALSASEAQREVWEANQAVDEAEQRMQRIIIPEVTPEAGQGGSAATEFEREDTSSTGVRPAGTVAAAVQRDVERGNPGEWRFFDSTVPDDEMLYTSVGIEPPAASPEAYPNPDTFPVVETGLIADVETRGGTSGRAAPVNR
jgi:hypothetical protein